MQADADAGSELRKQALRMLVPLAIVVALVVVWSFTAPISGAVVAPGQLKAELDRKTVQHQEGGIVREILVRNGQKVRAGQPLIVVGDVRSDAELSLLRDQLLAAHIRAARSTAEAALEPRFTPSAEIADDSLAVDHIAREAALFAARRRTLDEHVASLEMQIHEVREQTEALEAQIAATRSSATLAAEELALNEKLVREGFVRRTLLLQLRRAEADYRSRLADNRSELAVARQRAGELAARIAQARNQYQQQATDEVKNASAKVREIEERLRPSQDQVERQLVRSPVDGVVMSISVAAPGEAVGPREPLLHVVPTQEKLLVEARIRPQDINHVYETAHAEVRLTSFEARTTPLLPARVVFVSPDRVSDPERGESWFVAHIEVDAGSLRARPDIRLQAGMPAELFVTTSARTLFEYLAKPFTGFTYRAMREP
jgi:HlyD family type I secretion membrane fusion protein